jgi:hypothetical protein
MAITLLVIALGAVSAAGLVFARKRYHAATDLSLAPDPALLAHNDWKDIEIGNPGKPGSTAFNVKNGVWTVNGGGADIWLASDQFHFSGEMFSGDGELIAQVTQIPNTHVWAKSGVMFRVSDAPDSPFAHMVASQGGNVAFQWRVKAGENAASKEALVQVPVWVKVVRTGNTFSGWYSKDGANWTQLGTTQTVPMPFAVHVGLCVNAHNNATINATNFTNVSFLPPGWTSGDIAGPLPGGAVYDPFGKRWTIRGGGNDIWEQADQFHFVWRTATGDQTLQTCVSSIENVNPWTKAGLMIRAGHDPGAVNVSLLATPSGSICFEWRSAQGGGSAFSELKNAPTPVHLKLERKGNVFTAMASKDGAAWQQVGGPITVQMPAQTEVGYCVTAHEPGSVPTVIFNE